jgi:O-antigen ligase
MIARLVVWLLLALVVLIALPFGGNRPWAWSLLAMGSGTLLALWAVAAAVNPSLIAIAWRHYRPVAITFGCFLLWALFQATPFSPAAWHHPAWSEAAAALDQSLSGAISLSPSDSLNGVMRLLSYAIIFWLAMQLGRRVERARLIWWTLSLSITAYAVYGLAVQLGGSDMILWFPKWSYQKSLSATFVNRNHFAAYAGIGLILTLALIADETRKAADRGLSSTGGIVHFLDNLRPPLFVLMLAFVILMTSLLLSHSRGGAFCSALGILTMLVAFSISQGLRSRSLIAFGAIIFVVGVAILLVSGDAVVARMGELIENAAPREKVYVLALQAIAERPILGTGLGTFAQVYRLIRGSDFGANELTYDVAHNSYLEMAVEAGIPAALLLYASLAIIAGVFIHGARERRRAVIYPCSGLAVTVLLGTHSLIDFSLQIPAIAATFGLIAGAAYAQSWRHDERIEANPDRG